MRAPRSALVRLAMATSLALPTTGFALSGMARATGPGHTGSTTATLKGTGPTESVDRHDAASGGWTITVEGNKGVTSVRLAISAAPAEGCGVMSQDPIYSDKVTDDELASGPVTRSVGLEQGSYCTHFALDGVAKAQAMITTAHAEPALPDPDPTATPTPDPTETPNDYLSKEFDRCSDPSLGPDKHPYAADVDHRVLAGATGPSPSKPFIYQKFYPSTLQVHSGDLVEWCFNGGYDWHTVTFLPTDMDVAEHPEPTDQRAGVWRWDETGQKAFGEGWLFGHEEGDEAKQCGRGEYFAAAIQEPCELSATDELMSSSLWDRFFSVPKPGTFAARVDLEPGLYRYHCNVHSSMSGFIEVLPDDQETVNPSHEQIDAEIAQDHDAAQEVFEELSDPSRAYDFAARRWTVHVGAETPDRSVSIEQFLPSRIDVRKGDTVRYVAGTDEPNTVTFPGGDQVPGTPESDLQGGFSVTGRCDAHSCPTGRGAPWGMTGLAFLFNCDADGRASGAPGSLPYIPPATSYRTNGAVQQHGCVAGGLPEMITQPWYGEQQRAPGDLVVTPKTFHNSGTLLDETLPDWYRTWPAAGPLPAGTFPHTFDAKFPTDGTFEYFCAAHEFMNGVVVVKP